VLCSEKLNYADYVEKCIACKDCTFKFPTECDFNLVTEHRFQLTFGGETVTISIEARLLPKLPSELIFAQSVLKKIQLFSVAYGIVSINKCVTYITNEVLTSNHDCVFQYYSYDLDLPKRLAGCTFIRSTLPCIVKNLSFLQIILHKEISPFVWTARGPL
jgi:hypothetical protein